MKLFICCLIFIASRQAAGALTTFGKSQPNIPKPSPNIQSEYAQAGILRSDSDIYPDGNYQYGFESENAIQVQESGLAGVSVSGSAKWVDDEGTPFELTYTADENGYRPQGAHLPVAPPIPDYILRALAYIEAHPNENDPYAYVHQPDPDPVY